MPFLFLLSFYSLPALNNSLEPNMVRGGFLASKAIATHTHTSNWVRFSMFILIAFAGWDD